MIVEQPATALPAHVLGRDDMRAAIAEHDFGMVFALARKWAGISYSKIADECQIKPERVGSLARGEGRITSYEKVASIADALRIPGHMLGLAARLWESAPARFSVLESNFTSQPSPRDDEVFRRDFLKLGTGIATLGARQLIVGDEPRRVGGNLPDYLRARTARLRRLDNVLGGGDTFVVYLAEYEKTKSIIRQSTYSAETGKELLSVLSEQAQQAGWAAFDAGNQDAAVHLYKKSMAAAEEAGDTALQGNAFAFLAYQQLARDPHGALQLADASCEAAASALTGTVGALLHERRAWAYAVAGQAAETEKALDEAHAALQTTSARIDPDWSNWVDESELQIMAGRCWTVLRRPLRAVPILTSVLSGFDDTYARDKALYLSWLAESYLNAGEVEEAARVADQVLDLSAGVASVRPRQQLTGVLTRLSEEKQIPVITQVLEKARA